MSEQFKAPSFELPKDNLIEKTPGVENEQKPAHDPLGVILEKNVFESVPAVVRKTQLERIHSILKNRGMDSQQVEQSFREITEILGESK
jgi:hypothetical protein